MIPPPSPTPSEAETIPESLDPSVAEGGSINISEVKAEGPSSDRYEEWSQSTSCSRSYEDIFAHQEQGDVPRSTEGWEMDE